MGFFQALLGKCDTKPLDVGLWKIEGDKVKVQIEKAAVGKGGATYLFGNGLKKPILIVRTAEDKYLAFENSCPHGKRKIDPVLGEAKLRCCSLGHSTFDYDGKVLGGPAKGRGTLKRYAADMSGGELVITL